MPKQERLTEAKRLFERLAGDGGEPAKGALQADFAVQAMRDAPIRALLGLPSIGTEEALSISRGELEARLSLAEGPFPDQPQHVEQQWRGLATRYEKRAVNYRAMAVTASIVLWLEP